MFIRLVAAVLLLMSASALAAPTVVLTAPGANSAHTAPATLTLEAQAQPESGHGIAKVTFYANGNPVGERTTEPYSLSWSGVSSGLYNLSAIATDDVGATATSAIIPVTVARAAAPNIAISAPLAGAVFTAPAAVTVEATVQPFDVAAARVDFYANGKPIGSVDAPPYRLAWKNVEPGYYQLSAIVTDVEGGTRTSAVVKVSVVKPQAPLIVLSTPPASASFTAPATITLTADVQEGASAAVRVDFYASGKKLGSSSSAPPYQLVWENVPGGVYQLSAIVTDTYGSTRASAAIKTTVAVPPTTAPVVALSSPANNAVFAEHVPIPLRATASDSDGGIARVEFYVGTTLLATVTQAPFAFTWTDAVPGTYTLTAKGVDNVGATTRSAPITVTVKEAGQVYFIQADHLNTPRLITDAAANVVWRWDSDAFGSTPPDEDPSASGTLFVFNPRFPGQYFDAETGLHYNYFRDYDPRTGRYIQSDPIGLTGGINTYAYVSSNPLDSFDPKGLQQNDPRDFSSRRPSLGLPNPVARAEREAALALDRLFKKIKDFCASSDSSNPAWPGNDPSVAPPGTEWRGKPGSKPGSPDGNYFNPNTGESYRPDLNHPDPIGPHWDHKDPDGNWGRIYPDGRRIPK